MQVLVFATPLLVDYGTRGDIVCTDFYRFLRPGYCMTV
jgi:hypothetical protein